MQREGRRAGALSREGWATPIEPVFAGRHHHDRHTSTADPGQHAIAGLQVSVMDLRAMTGQLNQVSTARPGTRSNSRALLVMMTLSSASACAAIIKSMLPMGRPWRSKAARTCA